MSPPVLSRISAGQGFSSTASYKRSFIARSAGGAYQIARSLRFNSADSAYLSRTPASAGNRKTWTWAGWVKRSAISFSAEQHLWGVTGVTDATYGEMFFSTGDTLRFAVGYTTTYGITTTRVFRDASAWYHIVLAFDATQSTATNKIKLYINGVEETVFSSDTRSSLANQDWGYNNNVAHYIGRNPNGDIRHFNGYLADIHFIDGQALTPSSFTEVSATTGQLIPKAYTGSFGTNGFRLPFSDNSGTTSTTLGKDSAGSNNWTPNNFSVAAGAGNDSLVDTPTSFGTDEQNGGEVRGNYATWNPLDKGSSVTLANGNLDFSQTATLGSCRGTIGVSSGKWYWEVSSPSSGSAIGIMKASANISDYVGGDANGWSYYANNGFKYNSNSGASYGATFGSGDVIGVAFDADAGTLTFYKNGTSQGQAYSGLTSGPYFPAFGNGSTSCSVNFGQRAFAYTAPSGFKALCDTNLTAPVVAKSASAFDVKLYTGNGGTQTISGLNFSSDLIWIKSRSNAYDNAIQDSVRGITSKYLITNSTAAEADGSGFQVTAVTDTSFSVGAGTGYNTNAATYAAWCWDAGSSTVTNTQGSITSSVRANASAGFSIVSFSSGSAGNYTVGHGLGAKPHFIITKARNGSTFNWSINHISIATTVNKYLAFTTNATLDNGAAVWGANLSDTNSTTFGISSANAVEANKDCIAYCFAPVAGYSSFGSYTGNGSADGPFVYTGFRPRWILIKSTSGSRDWLLYDTARGLYNPQAEGPLQPNTSGTPYGFAGYDGIDILSNGFKLRTSINNINANTEVHVWAAFAESPFQYARAR